jgi:hypothetical protein
MYLAERGAVVGIVIAIGGVLLIVCREAAALAGKSSRRFALRLPL